jgi:hypothetical protein
MLTTLCREFFLDPTKRLIFIPDPKPPPKIEEDSLIDRLNSNQTSRTSVTDSKPASSVAGLLSQISYSLEVERLTKDGADDDKVQKGGWYNAKRFLWSGPEYFRVNRSLANVYPGCQHLFHDIIELRTAGLNHFVEEVSSFPRAQDDAAYPNPLDYMSRVLGAMDHYIHHYVWAELPYNVINEYYRDLRVIKMWPIFDDQEDGTYGFMTGSESDEWFIADRWDLQEIFAGLVPFLAFDPDKKMYMKNVFANLSLTNRYISTAAKVTMSFEGKRRLSPQYTERLQSKSSFLLR